MKKKKGSLKEKQTRCAPVEEEIRVMNLRIRQMEYQRDENVPLEEKLPKDSKFYAHYVNAQFGQLLKRAADSQIRCNQMFADVSNQIPTTKVPAQSARSALE